ncbi:hypothetical protein Bca4012_056546 [Brassica carinata]
MNSNGKSPVTGDLTAKKPNGKDVVSSAEPVKRAGQAVVSLATPQMSRTILSRRNQTAKSLSPQPSRSDVPAVPVALALIYKGN